MGLLTVYKASAGSGKTFRLTGTYLKLIFNPQVQFQSVLAVTFTNKATAEMRYRILKELHTLALGKTSNHAQDLKTLYNLTDSALQDRASFLLKRILHNYGSFHINTIDSFFQKTLKAFTRETGLGAGFNVELKIKPILEFGIAEFLDNAQSNPQLKKWLSEYAIQKIETNKSWNIEQDLFKFAQDAFNEVFFSFSEQQLNDFSNLDNFIVYKNELRTQIDELTKKLTLISGNARKLMLKHGLEVSDFAYGDKGVAGFIAKLGDGMPPKISEPGARVLSILGQPCNTELWHAKKTDKKDAIATCVTAGLDELLRQAEDWFNTGFIDYNTLRAILKELDVFAVIVEIFNQINEYCRAKNIFLLPLANPLLSKMIGDDDAPFIYEKTGDYLKYFMIDEFQDTSKMQWENFAPLVTNGISQNYESMVVGDVKQSIYRWRNGDWTLLHHKLTQKYKNFGVNEELLIQNWRSTPEVVAFNNLIFKHIPEIASGYFENADTDSDSAPFGNLVADIYSGAHQVVPTEKLGKTGYVEVGFKPNETGDTDKEENNQWYLNKTIEALKKLYAHNYNPRDIAILVRTGREGSLVAKHLMEYAQKNPAEKERFAFVSNDSVLLGASPIILLIAALLKYVANPKNLESRAAIIYFNKSLNGNSENAAYSFCDFDLTDADAFLSQLPSEFSDNLQLFSKLTLPALVDKLLAIFIYADNKIAYGKQLPFIYAFQDAILNYTRQNGNGLQGFIDWWDEFGLVTPITLGDDQNAIRIITIHKAKGLEYGAVIIPFANWNLNKLSNLMWCKTPEKYNRFEMVPVMYSKSLDKSHFKADYQTEFSMALIDNLNLLYVALTRAVSVLFVFAPESKSANEYKTVADILFNVLSTNNEYKSYWVPENYVFTIGAVQQMVNEPIAEVDSEIYKVALNVNRKIGIRQSAGLFYKNEDGDTATKINMGAVYHKVMEQVIIVSDIDAAIQKIQQHGILTTTDAENFGLHLKNLISQSPFDKWFSGQFRVMAENTIIVNAETLRRPDRVMIGPDEIIVVDYKFTDNIKPAHAAQVKEYMDYLMQMENEPIKGFVWYVHQNKLIEVN